MPYQRLISSFKEFVARLVIIAVLVGGAWLAMQYYTEEEIVAATRDFWSWWSTLFTGDLARYWNPNGAAVTLGVAVLFVLNPLARLLGLSRRRRSGGYANDSFDDFGGGDDGGSGD